MKLQDFDYTLPKELIAQYPAARRDQARLMVINRADGSIVHDIFARVGKYIPLKSLLVLNDSKVIPARLFGKRKETGGKVEVFLLQKLSDGYSYSALIRPLKKLKLGERIIFNGNNFFAELKSAEKKIVRFNRKNILPALNRLGHIPLPPYIKRNDEASDRNDYQTVYAKRAGSVASPTAGLHFTKPLLQGLKAQGHTIEKVTLHVNYATFKPVREEDITKHVMHEEEYRISEKTWERISKAKEKGKKIVAVGTTSCRSLESTAKTGRLSGKTNLFIYSGYPFKITDCLLTNFHTPKSTLLMLVDAFAGKKLIRRAYQEAIREKYRFFSYGDAMLIL